MRKADSLIRTKLRPPFTRTKLVTRPRLQEKIAQGLRGPLTLITAPAGFGKTTLLASCVESCGMPVAWLSLDKNDNQIGRFLSYLIAALREADHAIGSAAIQLLVVSQEAPIEAILTSLINELDSAGRETVLVLDDYQLITSQAVHEQMEFLLEHCPRTFHLVIATRSDPPLRLARLRARGQTIELRAADLRFTEGEAAQFLNDVMGLHLDAGAVATLAERTEGWIAGLQMAALSMRDREDVLGFIDGFSGTNRYILDYLLEEVLSNQPPEIQHFLLCTSILERLSAPLCDAVTSASLRTSLTDGEGLKSQSVTILEYLERANLFLIPLDDKRIWYRYHQLFADLLQMQLHKVIGAQGTTILHLHAAHWYEQNGFILEAINHASVASDDAMVERLIEQNYLKMANIGEMSSVRYWMGKLSEELIHRRPWLCLYEAMRHSWFGEIDKTLLLLGEAEKHIRSRISNGAPDADTRALLGYHDYVKSRVTAMEGDTRHAIELCRNAREIIPADNLGLQIDVSITLGYEYFLYGDFVNAEKILREMIHTGDNVRAINNPVAGYALLARLYAYQGRLHEAYALLKKSERTVREASGQTLGLVGLIDVGIAALLCEWNDIEEAIFLLKQGMELLPWWGKADDLCLAYSTLARAQLALGNFMEAKKAIDKASQLIQTCGVFSEAKNVIEAYQIKLWLIQGDWLAVDHWIGVEENRFTPPDSIRYEDERRGITLARALLGRDKPNQSIHLLTRLEESSRSAGRMGHLLEILLLKALAMQALGDSESTFLSLTNCLTFAEPEGYRRIFLDEGKPMQQLLASWLTKANPGSLRDYAGHLLSKFEEEIGSTPLGGKHAPPISSFQTALGEALIEPLSRRELEVLQQIAVGRTNQEIARQLFISPGTVKAHTASIYRKLDVANRTEAVTRARQLGILS